MYRHVFGPGEDEPLVSYEGTGLTTRRFLHADERGSIVAVTDGTGTVQNVNTYDEYGKVAYTNGSYLPRFLFTGQRYFGGLQFYFYKSRAYNQRLGRFMQADPIGFEGGMNLYAYAGGDPVNFTDPTGLQGEGSIVVEHPGLPDNVATFFASGGGSVFGASGGGSPVVPAGRRQPDYCVEPCKPIVVTYYRDTVRWIVQNGRYIENPRWREPSWGGPLRSGSASCSRDL